MTLNLTPSERVGKNLKHYIKQSIYVTQARFAAACNYDETTIRRYICHGVRDLDTICFLADMLDIDYKELLK